MSGTKRAADPALVRDLCRQVKKAKQFQIRKIIRKLAAAPESKKQALESRLAACKSLRQAQVVRLIVTKELQSEVPRNIEREWRCASQGAANEPTASLDETSELVKQIRGSKMVETAVDKLALVMKAAAVDSTKRRKRQRDQSKPRTIECGLNQCTAKFATEEAKRTHQVRRHAALVETDNLEADPFAALEQAKTKGGKKNRLGQRARRREAIKKQIQVHQEHIKRGEKPPAYKHIIIPGREKVKPGAPKVSAAEESAANQIPDEEDMHPSWQAKRKEKSIKDVEFKGKRVTFD